MSDATREPSRNAPDPSGKLPAGQRDESTFSLARGDEESVVQETPAVAQTRSSGPAWSGDGALPPAGGEMPDRIGRYRPLRLLGQGSFGAVYLAHDPELERAVALKVPRPDRFRQAEDIDRFLAEARLAARLRHSGIVAIHDVLRDAARVCVVQEYVPGEDLKRWAERQGPRVPWPRAVDLVARIAEIVAYAHQQGLVHRDLKPANILIDAAGQPHVLDFGLAIDEQHRVRAVGERSGSPAYMSPEQARGDTHRLDGRSDVWSLGVILYELLAGRRPFRADGLTELFAAIDHVEPQPLRQLDPSLPAELDGICRRALAKRPADRYTAAGDLADDLRRIIAAAQYSPVAASVPSGPLASPGDGAAARDHVLETERSFTDDLLADVWAFGPFLDDKRRGFCGRAWVFDAIREWWQSTPDERVLLVVGEPGVGKSALASELVHGRAGGSLGAWYCCQVDTPATLEPWRFVRHCAGMLACRLPAFAEQLRQRRSRDVLERAACQRDPVAALEQGILAPLHAIHPAPGDVVLIVADALDEALGLSGPLNLVNLLGGRAEQLPGWMRLVATTRSAPEVLAEFGGARTLELTARDERNLADADGYLAERLSLPAVQRRLAQGGVTADSVTALLRERSEGNFLYLRSALDGLERGLLRTDQLGALPPRLTGLYRSFLQRDFPDEAAFALPRVVLEVVLAAHEPLGFEELAAATGVGGEELGRVLESLAVYLPRRVDPDGKERHAVYHKSLADWLGDSGRRGKPYFVDTAAGHRRLADAGWSAYQRGSAGMPRYDLRHLPAHLAAAERASELVQLLTDADYLEAKVEAGYLFELVEELSAAQRMASLDSSSRHILRLYHEAILRDVQFLAVHPELLFQCLWNTCSWHGEGWREHPHGGGVAAAGDVRQEHAATLAGRMEAWRQRRRTRRASRPWLRSLLPPLVPLGAAQRAVLRGHAGLVRCVACSPDGLRIVSGSGEGGIRCWDADLGRGLKVLKGHERGVVSLAFSTDGSRLISAALDNRVILWDAASYEPLACITGTGSAVSITRTELPGPARGDHDFEGEFTLRSAALSPGGETVAMGMRDGRLLLWEEPHGPVTCQPGHLGSIYSAVFSRDGRRVFTGSRDSTVGIWDAATGRLVQSCRGHRGWVMRVALSPDGRWLASGSSDRTVRLWDAATGQLVNTLTGHADAVLGVAFAEDGRRLVSASQDGTVRIWDPQRGVEIRCLSGHEHSVVGVAVCPRTGWIISGSVDRTVRIWDVEDPAAPLTPRERTPAVRCAAFSPDGRRLAVGMQARGLPREESRAVETLPADAPSSGAGGESERTDRSEDAPRGTTAATGVTYDAQPPREEGRIEIWDAVHGVRLSAFAAHDDTVTCVAISPDGRWLASGSQDRTVRVWDVEAAREACCYRGHYQTVADVQFSPAGGSILSFAGSQRAHVWDLVTGEERLTISAGEREAWQVASGPSGPAVISATPDGDLRRWDLETGRVIQWLHGHEQEVNQLAFSAEGRLLATASDDRTVIVWDPVSGSPRHRLRGHEGVVTSIRCCEPRGRSPWVVSGSYDATVRLWDAESGAGLRVLAGHTGWVTCLDVCPAAGMIASGASDHAVRVWDEASGLERHCLRGHEGTVTALAFRRDGRCLASASRDHRVLLWDPQTGRRLQVLAGHGGWVNDLCFSDDDRWLVSGSDDETVRIWDLDSGAEVARLEVGMVVETLSLDTDRRQLVLGGRAGIIQIHEFPGGKLVRSLRTARQVTRMTFAADGRHLIGWDEETPIRWWDASSGRPVVEHESLWRVGVSRGMVGSPRHLRPEVTANGTVFLDSAGEVVAWYSVPFQSLAVNADGTAWAGRAGGRLALLRLERD